MYCLLLLYFANVAITQGFLPEILEGIPKVNLPKVIPLPTIPKDIKTPEIPKDIPKFNFPKISFNARKRRFAHWLKDEAYNARHEQWYKYDCKRVPYYDDCQGKNGGIFFGRNCFKPQEVNIRSLHLDDGWHKKLTCKMSSKDDNVVLAVNVEGKAVAVGRGSVTKIIRCNDRGVWVTKNGKDKEIEIEDAFCYSVPYSDD